MSTTETSEQLRAQAQEIRDRAEALRTEQRTVLAVGQQEADRLHAEGDRVLAETRNEANRLMNEAARTDREAEPIRERAVLQQAAEDIVEAIPAVESRITDLYAEIETLAATITGLSGRLEDLGVDREDLGVQLAGAREAGDVDGVVAARARMTAVDEVAAALENQKRVAEQRVVAIGAPDGDGELGQAERLVVGLRTQQRQVLNQLDPERPEAQADALVQQITEFAHAQHDRLREQQNPAVRRTTTIIQN